MNLTKQPHEYDFNALKNFTPGDDQVFIDVGSNRGEAIYSMLLTSKTETPIIGFEPNGLIYKKLSARFVNEPRVKLYNSGIGNLKEELTLFVPFYRKWMFDGLSSFNYTDAAEWLKTRLWNYTEKNLTVKEIQCEIDRLDGFNLNPYFIKIDVQGFEIEVLKGAKTTIEKHLPIILIESICKESTAFLEEFGYQFYSYVNGKMKLGRGKLNTYCIVKGKLGV